MRERLPDVEARMPPLVVEGLIMYRDHHVKTGGFLEAVLSNDLKEACGRADVHSARSLVSIVEWCYNCLPSVAWGSPERFNKWLEKENG